MTPGLPKKPIPWNSIFFHATLLSVFSLWLYLFLLWRAKGLALFTLITIPFEPLPVMAQNLKRCFDGYHSGYVRTALGFGIFAMMAMSFIATGRFALRRLFNFRSNAGAIPFSAVENMCYSYILGSLILSIFWLMVGSLLGLNSALGWGVMGSGTVWALTDAYKTGCWRNLTKWTKGLFSEFTSRDRIFEKMLSLFLIALLALCAANGVRLQSYSDVFQIHLALPTYYVNEGRVVPNPYEIYSYFPQNLEMLATWALLLKSEVAAVLIMWGFFVAFTLLVWTFLKRNVNPLSALLGALIFISPPFIQNFSTAVKNDLPVALFLCAHYFALAEGLNHADENHSKRWLLFAGILCGGAVGHKHTALIPAAVSSVFIFWRDFSSLKKTGSPKFISPYWFSGLAVFFLPWFIRTTILTGNPVYPYLQGIFGNPLVQEWHRPVPRAGAIAGGGLGEFLNYFKGLLGLRINGNLFPPDLGPTALFGLLVPLCFLMEIPVGLRITLALAAASWAGLALFAMDARYHMAPLAYMVVTTFSLTHHSLETAKSWIQKYSAPLVLLLCFHLTFFQVGIWGGVSRAWSILLSGYSPANYRTSDSTMDNLRWLSHFINTRTSPEDSVMYVAVGYHSGLERKNWFNDINTDKQILQHWAEQSPDTEALYGRIKSSGISHFIVDPSNLRGLAQSHFTPECVMRPREWALIQDFFIRFTSLRLVTPDRKLWWHSLRGAEQTDPIVLMDADIREFPIQSIQYADLVYSTGKYREAETILNIAVQQPMLAENKAAARILLDQIHLRQKERAQVR